MFGKIGELEKGEKEKQAEEVKERDKGLSGSHWRLETKYGYYACKTHIAN